MQLSVFTLNFNSYNKSMKVNEISCELTEMHKKEKLIFQKELQPIVDDHLRTIIVLNLISAL